MAAALSDVKSPYTPVIAYNTYYFNVTWMREFKRPSHAMCDAYTESVLRRSLYPGCPVVGITHDDTLVATTVKDIHGDAVTLTSIGLTVFKCSLSCIPKDASNEWLRVYASRIMSVCFGRSRVYDDPSDLSGMLKSNAAESYPDVSICGGIESVGRRAHRGVLVWRSPMFKKLSESYNAKDTRWILPGAADHIIELILMKSYSNTIKNTIKSEWVDEWDWEKFKQAILYFQQHPDSQTDWVGWLCGCFSISTIVNYQNAPIVTSELEALTTDDSTKLHTLRLLNRITGRPLKDILKRPAEAATATAAAASSSNSEPASKKHKPNTLPASSSSSVAAAASK